MTETLDLNHLIDGERVDVARPGERLNPSDTNDRVANMPDAGQAEVDAAVAAALPVEKIHIAVAAAFAFFDAAVPGIPNIVHFISFDFCSG